MLCFFFSQIRQILKEQRNVLLPDDYLVHDTGDNVIPFSVRLPDARSN